jgi:isoleucyl-tRNA synthetase
VLTHGFTLDEKGRKMSKSLGNVVDPAVLVEGGKNEKQEPAYGADVLRLWVSSVDYSADVPLGPGIVKQLADVYRKVRNTARYLLGNLHDFNPSTDAVPIVELPLLDRWMLQRTAKLIDSVSADFERYEFYRFFQALQNFCVVDLSNVYLDIAKDRLYVSGADSFRRRSCQTVLHLVVERLAGLIAPVLCHMAEDIWQNLPYPVAEASVFERGWPTVPEQWISVSPRLEQDFINRVNGEFVQAMLLLLSSDRSDREQGFSQLVSGPIDEIFGLRNLVNRQLQECRSQSMIGPSLEAQVLIHPQEGKVSQRLNQALDLLKASSHPEVDNLKDWLLVSSVSILAEDPLPHVALLIPESTELGIGIGIARADGHKCERCWHFETDIGKFSAHPSLCGRCVEVLEG